MTELSICLSSSAAGFSALFCLLQDLFTQDCEPEHMHALLRRLNCAALHSRAAYGYAMAAGHLSSLVNFALLQTVSSPLLMMQPMLPCCNVWPWWICLSIQERAGMDQNVAHA